MGETPEIEKREPGEHKRDNVVSTGLDADKFRRFEDFRAEKGLKSGPGVSHLIDAGLRAEQGGIQIGISGGLIWAGSLMIATQVEITLQAVSGDWFAVLGFLLMVLGVAYGYVKE